MVYKRSNLRGFYMKLGRFFVTAVAILATLGTTACHSQKKETRRTLALEGSQKLTESQALAEELYKTYRIKIVDEPWKLSSGVYVDSTRIGSSYNWRRLTLAERQAAKEKLAQMITLLSRVMEIDAKKGLYIDRVEKVRSRYKGAIAFQNSLRQFEEIYGEQADLKGTENERVYGDPIEL